MLELRRLRYFVVLAKRLSFSRAADDLGIAQSTLTRAIQALEAEIGLRLFDRDSSGVTLTEQGRWLVEKADTLLISAKDLEHHLAFAARGAEGRVRFGMTHMPSFALLRGILTARIGDAPGFMHEVLVRDVGSLWKMMTRGELEFLVSLEWHAGEPDFDSLPVRAESLGEFPMSLVVRKDHPALDRGTGIKGFPMLVASPDSQSWLVTKLLRDRFDAPLQVVEEYGILSGILQDSDAIWLTSPFAVAREIAQGALVEIPLPPDLQPRSIELFMYSLVRRSQSPAVLQLKQAFRRNVRTLHSERDNCG